MFSISGALRDIISYQTEEEGILAKRGGAYKSEKRRKELTRLKKREEKRQRRLHKETSGEQGAEGVALEETEGITTEEKANSESIHSGDTNP